MRVIIYPHQMASKGAKNLRDVFKSKGFQSLLVRPDGKYLPRKDDFLIGWGNSTHPTWARHAIKLNLKGINNPDCIRTAVNKIDAFKAFQKAGVEHLPSTTESVQAQGWLQDGFWVVGRQKVEGSRAEGLLLFKTPEDFRPCPLYTKFCKSDREYRIYVVGDKVVDYLQKRRPNGAGPLEPIRSAALGWVYCRTDIKPLPDKAKEEAVKAVKALGLQFGGVDLLWGNKSGPRIIEVNTSPGIGGQGVEEIADALVEILGE